MSVRILIVEDHALLSQALAEALHHDGYEVRRMEHTTAAGILRESERFSPAVVLLGLRQGNGLSLIEPLRRGGASVVMLTAEKNPAQLEACLDAGAAGVVSKSESFDHLVAGVQEAADIADLVPPEARDDLINELQHQREQPT